MAGDWYGMASYSPPEKSINASSGSRQLAWDVDLDMSDDDESCDDICCFDIESSPVLTRTDSRFTVRTRQRAVAGTASARASVSGVGCEQSTMMGTVAAAVVEGGVDEGCVYMCGKRRYENEATIWTFWGWGSSALDQVVA